MQGQQLHELEMDNIWTSLRIIGGIANELVPLGDPKHIPSIALGPEYELAGALYYMSRSVVDRPRNVVNPPLLFDYLHTNSFISLSSQCAFTYLPSLYASRSLIITECWFRSVRGMGCYSLKIVLFAGII